jgi:hypothetical protein
MVFEGKFEMPVFVFFHGGKIQRVKDRRARATARLALKHPGKYPGCKRHQARHR